MAKMDTMASFVVPIILLVWLTTCTTHTVKARTMTGHGGKKDYSSHATGENAKTDNSAGTNEENANKGTATRLIIVSLDGFRWDYMTRTATPNLDYVVSHGVTAKRGLTAGFITKTFPNHFTLATGLWEEDHGIVANHMYDPSLNETFSRKNVSALKDPAWFDVGAEPIWVTNQLQGGRSGVVMWIGGWAPIKGVRPSEYVPFNPAVTNESKFDMVIDWFKREGESERINLAMVYFNQPDAFGHWFGPESQQVTRMIGGMDRVIGYLLKRLEDEGLANSTDVIVTSDHGFVTTPSDKVIDLDRIIDPEFYRLSEPSPVAAIWPKPGYFGEIYGNLTKAARASGHFTVFLKEKVPEHFHYTHNRRIGPIQLLAQEAYSFTARTFPFINRGDHGYSNELQSMRPFFVAMGPSFKQNASVDTFPNVDVYPLMCHLLHLQPAPNNGSLDVVSKLLQVQEPNGGQDRSRGVGHPTLCEY